jgi:hypothetical protein
MSPKMWAAGSLHKRECTYQPATKGYLTALSALILPYP